MSLITALPAFTPDTTVGEIVAARPLLARVFEKLGIDFCCGGKQTLTAVCARHGLDVATTLVLLESAGHAFQSGRVEVDAAAMDQVQLADHIEAVHHAYLKTELPRLVEMAARVAEKHGWRDARLRELEGDVRALAEEMLSHMQKEELVLFPIVRHLAGGGTVEVAGPIAQMEEEHTLAGNLTARLRELTDGFRPGVDACNTHRALLAGLAEFEADLHRHVHKENNILFPRALAQAQAKTG
jgi:regulator of cell morphogenesis and NO signaling